MAKVNFVRFKIPRPKYSLGLQTSSQFTLHLPMMTFSIAAHKKSMLYAINLHKKFLWNVEHGDELNVNAC
jgi:hypothetical protein